MLGVALLVFREVLEAALIISIVCAASRGLPRRGQFVLGGVALGLGGALAVAIGAEAIANLAGGAGRDLFNALVMLAAVLMIGWHVIWMARHGRESARQMQVIGDEARSGVRSLLALLVVVALTVLREGSEIVLFLFGMAAGGIGSGGLTAGVALGVSGGAALGAALYWGLLRVPLQSFFGVTNALLVLLASGLAAGAAGFLVQSDWLPSWGSQVWDTSNWLSDESIPGKTFGILVGYRARPEGIQVVFYLVTLALLCAMAFWVSKRQPAGGRRPVLPAMAPAAAMTAMAALLMLGASGLARADDFIVYSPHVQAQVNEVEIRGYRYGDSRTDHAGSAAELSISRGVNAWWKPELYLLMYKQEADTPGKLQAYEFENTFQFSPPGERWADLGFLLAYEHRTIAGMPDAIETGPLIEKTIGRFSQRLNFIWEKQVGGGASSRFEYRYSYSGTYAVSQSFHPGIEAYGRPADRAYHAGPIATGEWHIPGTNSNLEYRVGVALGINPAAPRQTWLAQLEYEFY